MSYKANGLSVLFWQPSGTPGAEITFPDAFGVYGNVRADSTTAVSAATDAINFSEPINDGGLTANRTFTESNKSRGRYTVLLLDDTGSPNNYVPTFSSNIIWPYGVEPTWSDYNRWHIGLLCIDDVFVLANPMGFVAA